MDRRQRAEEWNGRSGLGLQSQSGKMKFEIHGNEDNMSTYLLCNRVKTEVAARGPPTLVYLGGLRMHMW